MFISRVVRGIFSGMLHCGIKRPVLYFSTFQYSITFYPFLGTGPSLGEGESGRLLQALHCTGLTAERCWLQPFATPTPPALAACHPGAPQPCTD